MCRRRRGRGREVGGVGRRRRKGWREEGKTREGEKEEEGEGKRERDCITRLGREQGR